MERYISQVTCVNNMRMWMWRNWKVTINEEKEQVSGGNNNTNYNSFVH